ncbi:hypothetical protein B0H11DRAFT_2389156 [Mycena galericulata]|nr:hypothetical protein B0H11DRAFT_2389156 [Mycena galericulata]
MDSVGSNGGGDGPDVATCGRLDECAKVPNVAFAWNGGGEALQLEEGVCRSASEQDAMRVWIGARGEDAGNGRRGRVCRNRGRVKGWGWRWRWRWDLSRRGAVAIASTGVRGLHDSQLPTPNFLPLPSHGYGSRTPDSRPPNTRLPTPNTALKAAHARPLFRTISISISSERTTYKRQKKQRDARAGDGEGTSMHGEGTTNGGRRIGAHQRQMEAAYGAGAVGAGSTSTAHLLDMLTGIDIDMEINVGAGPCAPSPLSPPPLLFRPPSSVSESAGYTARSRIRRGPDHESWHASARSAGGTPTYDSVGCSTLLKGGGSGLEYDKAISNIPLPNAEKHRLRPDELTDVEIEQAILPLFDYTLTNLQTLNTYLSDTAKGMVMTRVWKGILIIIEELLVPPTVRHLQRYEANQKYRDVVSIRLYYDWHTDALMEECVHMMQQSLRSAPTTEKRAKSVYRQRNLGTIKERKKEKREEKDLFNGRQLCGYYA